jgi:hypothetical protein
VCTENSILIDYVTEAPNVSGEARCRKEWTLFRLPGSKRLSGRKPDLFAPTPVDSNCISGVAKRRLLMG